MGFTTDSSSALIMTQYLSTFDLFRIGIGPSSSHTVGPMRAGKAFIDRLGQEGILERVRSVTVTLHGSLGATGRGHATDRGVILGLMGESPEAIEPALVPQLMAIVTEGRRLTLGGRHSIEFDSACDIRFENLPLPAHPNALTLHAWASGGEVLSAVTYYSIGGGFITADPEARGQGDRARPPRFFDSGAALLELCRRSGQSIARIMLENELTWNDAGSVRAGLLNIWQVMEECVTRGCSASGPLPSSGIQRRAPDLMRRLDADTGVAGSLFGSMEWINLFAIAVNEENAAGGRVVTAPTNGAAGIIPAVLHYYVWFVPDATDDGICDFLLTAAAIGTLYKLNASISGAEVGCQGEVGVACSMAAGALAAVLGGTPEQVEHAAEIGMEHNLGLTCDPVGGLVQVPCIERNAIAAVKAVNAAAMALRGDGTHTVSLDAVIHTMRETGADMHSKYKETSLGGLAVRVALC